MKTQSIYRKIARYCPQKHCRYILLVWGGVRIGKNSYISKKVNIGGNTNIGNNVMIQQAVSIGNNVCIGDNIKIYKSTQIGNNIRIMKEVEIQRNALIGDNVIIGKGAYIGVNASIRNAIIGDYTGIERNVFFTGVGSGKIRIGKESYIGINDILDWSDNITIGDYVHIAGPSTGLWTHTSVPMCLNSIPLSQKGKKYRPTAPIVVEDNVYIGGNCTIYPGVTIHHHSIILPNSAVSKDVAPFSMVGGCPARAIKKVIIKDGKVSFEKLSDKKRS